MPTPKSSMSYEADSRIVRATSRIKVIPSLFQSMSLRTEAAATMAEGTEAPATKTTHSKDKLLTRLSLKNPTSSGKMYRDLKTPRILSKKQ